MNKYKHLKRLAKLRFERTLYNVKAVKTNVREFFGGRLQTEEGLEEAIDTAEADARKAGAT